MQILSKLITRYPVKGGRNVTHEQRPDGNGLLQELITAASACDVARCHAILDSGLDVNTPNSAGCTALMFAVMPDEYGDPTGPDGILRTVEALLARGADPKIVDKFGMNGQDYARQLIDPDWKDHFGDSALKHWNSSELKTIGKILALLEGSG